MKKFIPLLLLLFFAAVSAGLARNIKIKVSNFQFMPKNVNAKVGDTITWMWVNGNHTTTSLGIPAGAATWDKPMNTTHKKFVYKLTKKGVYNYDCTIHASSMIGKITVTLPTVAGLDDFTVKEENAGAMLNWKISSSKDVSYFSVQRSTNADNFTEITRVNPNASNTYSFKDNSVLNNKYIYYQLELVDVKGNRQLSPIQMFTNNRTASTKLITSLSPNPVSSPGHLMLQFNAAKDGSMLVKLFNQNGTLLKQANMSAVKGLNNGHFHMGNLSPGTYHLVCTLGSATETHTVVVK